MGNRRAALRSTARLADAGTSLEERKLSAGETTIVHEFVAHGAARPAAAKHGFVAIQPLLADFAMTRLDRKQHRFPIAAGFANAHGTAV